MPLLLPLAPLPLVSYDTDGGGTTPGSVSSLTWAHTIGATANALLTGLQWNGSAETTVTVKVGSTSLVQLGTSFEYYTANTCYLAVFGLLNPPTGSQTMTVTFSTAVYSGGNSFSYNNVSRFGTPVTNSGTSASATLSVPSNPGQMVFSMWGSYATSGSFSAFTNISQNMRWNPAVVAAGNVGMAAGDAPGAGTVAFATTTPGSAAVFGGVGIPLL